MKTIYKKLLFLMLLLPFGVFAQSTFEGTVVDKVSNQPIPGVNVQIQGASNGTQTDFDGKFKLLKVKKGDKIVFSYMGYTNYTITYDAQNNLTVKLEEESNQLQEVLIQVGYGSAKKKDATGSVTLISSKDFNKGPVLSADQLIVGKAAGVRITTEGGQPDAKPNIRIRGGASLSLSNDPLIVIDGVPIDNTNPAGVSNPFSLINPNDIESFSILKDASSTAIYGSRASNGVIIITTKKGSSGAPQFNYSATTSISNLPKSKQIQMMDGPTFTNFIQKNHPQYTYLLGIDDPNTPLKDSPGEDNPATPQIEGRILSNTDWQDLIFRTAYSYEHNFSARANLFKKIPFRGSIGYVNTEGLVKTNDYERVSGSLKLTPMLFKDHLKIDVNAKLLRARKNAIDADGAISSAVNMDPTRPVYGESPDNRFEGYYQNTRFDNVSGRYNLDGQTNPLYLLNGRRRPEITTKLLGNIEFDYKLHFFPDLRAVLNLGIEASRTSIDEIYTGNAISTYKFVQGNNNSSTNYVFNPGTNYKENQTITNKTMDAYLAYSKKLSGFVSKFDAQAGYSYQNFVNDGNKVNYEYDANTGLRIEKIDLVNRNNRYYNVNNLQSFFARSNVDLLEKYLFTLTLRADGSSFFSPEKRWGYFPAVGFAWKVNEEKFLKDSKTVKELKLRLGYGITGQQNISGIAKTFYPYTPFFGLGNSESQYLPGATTYYAKPFDPTLTWEKTYTYNAGIDFSLFKNNMITGSFDVYNRITKDLLARVPSITGQALTNEFVKNVGQLSNRGFEFSMAVKPIDKENLTWQLNGNIAHNLGRVDDLRGKNNLVADESNIPTSTGIKIARYVVGEQPYTAWVYEQVYDQAGNPIVGAYVDRNGDGVISDKDRYDVALRPNWTFGFGTNFTYKKFDLNASFRGQINGKIYNTRNLVVTNIDHALPGNSNSLNNMLDAALPFQNIQEPIPTSDYFLEDASFIRCENITLGYRFPNITKGSTLKLFVSGTNLFIITKYSGQDPENFNAIDNNFYPRPSVYSFGVNLDF
ncbi:SusC/RagA family TonB-linked outer membrane protein [Flavobacterium sp.]|uniref:SusC/RagA family TonB-linked outer membrane protein n=1 Tax=Flavobacterium sp. TaxID=239 RepID=UPI002625138D|nr:SusC/RagA family TonB-linked outer membrane protein [Flavobacterium sp.]